jgi:hypothetical protein
MKTLRMNKNVLVAGLGGLSLLALLGAAQVPPKFDSSVERSYVGSDGVKIEGLGVCSYSADQIDCWNMDGVKDAKLTELVKAYYLINTYSELSFAFGKKNRLIVIRHTPQNYSVNFQSESGAYVNWTQLNNGPTEWTTGWGRVVVDDSPFASIVAMGYGLPGPAPIDVSYTPGSTGDIDGFHIVIGTYEKSDATMLGGPIAGQKRWTIKLASTSSNPSDSTTLVFTALDKDHQPISYVDKDGKPASALDVAKGQGGWPNGGLMGPNQKYQQVFLSTYGSQNGLMTVQSNIDPSKISFLKIGSQHQLRVRIGGFPMDPKQ